MSVKIQNTLVQDGERKQVLAEAARLMSCVLLSSLGFYLIALFFFHVYHPDVSGLIEEAKALMPEHLLNDVRPEPFETLLYNIGLLYFPLSLLGLYALFSNRFLKGFFSRESTSTLILHIVFLGLLVLGFFTLREPNPFLGARFSLSDSQPTNFKVFFAPLVVARKPLQYLVFVPAIVGLWYALCRLKPLAYKRVDLILGLACNLLAAWLLWVIYSMNCYDFPDTWQGQYDLNAVYYSQTQTMAGSPVLVNGVSNTYGGYPLFLAPLFRIISFDIAHFTMVMSLLIVFCVLCWVYLLNRFTRSRLLAATGMVSLLFFGYLMPYLYDGLANQHTFDSYFANAPIRWVFPACTLLLAALYCNRRPRVRNVVYWIGFLLLPLGIIWCPDFGLISCVAWLLFLLFHDFWANGIETTDSILSHVAWKTELRHIVLWMGGILVSFGLAALFIRMAYGAWPDYRILFSTAIVFGKLNFFALPMQACHPWIMVVLMFCMGLAYSLSAFYRRRVDSRSSVIFLLSILGCGVFIYFKARSYHNNLMQPALYAMMLGILFTDILWYQLREKKAWRLCVPAFFCLLLFGSSVPESMCAVPALKGLTRLYHGNKRPPEKIRIRENKAFIHQYSRKTDKVWVLTSNKFQSFYFDKPTLQSAFNPGFLDLNMLVDYERAKATLQDSSFTVFLDGAAFYYGQWQDLRSILASRYVVDTQYRQADKTFFSALQVRTQKIPDSGVLVRPNESPLLYRKYADNLSGYDLRTKDARGFPFVLDEQFFSVEIIFLNALQHYSPSALFSQYTDTSGIALFNVHEDGNSSRYVLACGRTQRLFQLPSSNWNYVVMNFMPDALDLYVNTIYYGRILLDRPYRPGTEKFYVGAQNGMFHYMGAISEIAIHRGLQTESGMKSVSASFR